MNTEPTDYSNSKAARGLCGVDGCEQPALTQDRCCDHAIVCPKCGEEPCNGDLRDPECGVCINAYRPEKSTEEEERDPYWGMG